MIHRHQDDTGRRPTPEVRIVHLNGPTFQALAQGDLAAANMASPVPLSAYFAGPDWRGVWQIRSRQVEETRPARRGSPASSGTNSGIWRWVGPATTGLRTQRG